MGLGATPKIKNQRDYYFIDAEAPTNTDETAEPSSSDPEAHDDEEIPSSVQAEETSSLLTQFNPRAAKRKRILWISGAALLLLVVGGIGSVVYIFHGDIADLAKGFFSKDSDDNDTAARTATNLTSAPSSSVGATTTTPLVSPSATPATSLPTTNIPTSPSPTFSLPTATPSLLPTTQSPTRVPTGSPTAFPVNGTCCPIPFHIHQFESLTYFGLIAITTVPTAIPTGTSTTTVAPTFVPDCDMLNFTFVEQSNDVRLDMFLNGYGPGDVYLFEANDLFLGSRVVGTSRGRCIVLEDVDLTDNVYCTMEFRFFGQDETSSSVLVVQGVLFELAAIAGTGCFAHVQGWMDLQENEQNQYGYTFNFHNETDYCPNSTSLLTTPWLEALPTNGEASDTEIDWNGNGRFDAGDLVVFDANTFVTAGGAQGFLEGECMGLYDPVTDSVDPNRPFCVMTFYTEAEESDDILMVQGIYDNMVITTALGCFYGVSGIVSGSVLQDGGGYRYDLVLDDNSANNVTEPSCIESISLFNYIWTEDFGDLLVNYRFQPPPIASAVDDAYDEETPGDVIVFDKKIITVNSTDTVAIGVGSGRCVFLTRQDRMYCNMVFALESGSIALQGDFSQMIVVGASGCFQGLQGVVYSNKTNTGFSYSWDVSSSSP